MSPDLLPEDRLRDALRAEAARVEPADDTSLTTIRRRGRAAIARRRAVVGGLSAVVVAAGAFLAVSQLGDDDQTVIVEPGPEETTTSLPTTTEPPPAPTTTPPTTPVPVEQAYLWPPPGHATYTDPVEAARSFVTEYVGFTDPQFGEIRDAEPGLVEVDVLALNENGQPFGGRIWSTLHIARSADGSWRVRSAASDEVVIEGVEATDAAVTVRGRGTGFEGTLNGYALDVDGSRLGEPSIITVDCCSSLQPFESTIAVPERPVSVLVISGTGLEGGSFFAAVPVASGASAGTAVSVYFVGLDGAVVPVLRSVTPPAVLNGALVALFDGPSADELARGLTTSLPANAGEFDSTASITAGVAHVDIPIGIAQPDPSQPAHTLPPDYARIMVEQMWRTVFQFDNISQVEFTLSGSCEDFGRWTGLGDCRFDR